MTTRPRVVVAGTLPTVGLGLLEERWFAVAVGGVPADAAWLRAVVLGWLPAIVMDDLRGRGHGS